MIHNGLIAWYILIDNCNAVKKSFTNGVPGTVEKVIWS